MSLSGKLKSVSKNFPPVNKLFNYKSEHYFKTSNIFASKKTIKKHH